MKKKETTGIPLSPEKMAALVPRLGKEKDIDLGREFGISRQRIGQIRTGRDIPRFQPEAKMGYPIPVHFTGSDERDMKRALKKTGEKNRSKYIRGAVRDKNKEVLGG